MNTANNFYSTSLIRDCSLSAAVAGLISLIATYSGPMLIVVQAAQAGVPVTITVLVALLVCLIPTTIGGLLSAIGIAGSQAAGLWQYLKVGDDTKVLHPATIQPASGPISRAVSIEPSQIVRVSSRGISSRNA